MKLNDFLKGVIVVCLFATLLIPFVIFPVTFFPYIVGKAFVFRTIVEIGFVAWVILALRDVDFRPKRSWLLWTVGIFLLVILIADIFGVDPKMSIWSNFERMEGYITLAHLGVYFLMLISAFQKRTYWNFFWHSSLAVSLIVSIQGFLEAVGLAHRGVDVIRIQTTFGNTIYVAAFLVINIFIALIYLIRSKGWVALSYGALIVIQGFAVYLTLTRGAIVGLGAGILLAAILFAIFEKENKVIRRSAFGVIALAFVFIAVFFVLKNSEAAQQKPIIARLTSISFESGTGFSRKLLWTTIATEGVKERPILGWGQNNFTAVFDKYYDPRLYGHEQWFDRTHNIIFDWLIAGGILGLLSYLGMYVISIVLLCKSKKVPRGEKFLLIGLLTAYLIQNMFVFDSLTNYLMFFAVLAFIHSETADDKLLFINKFSNTAVYIGAVVAIIVFVVAFNTSVYRGYVANTNLIKGMQLFAETSDKKVVAFHGDIHKNLDFLKASINANSFYGFGEIRPNTLTVAEKLLQIQNLDDEYKDATLLFAQTEMQKQVDDTPYTARYYYMLGLHYGRLGDTKKSETLFEQAKTLLEQAVEISPKKQTILEPYAAILEVLGETDKAIEVAKYSYELEPTNVNAFRSYVETLKRNGKTALAEEEIKKFEAAMK